MREGGSYIKDERGKLTLIARTGLTPPPVKAAPPQPIAQEETAPSKERPRKRKED